MPRRVGRRPALVVVVAVVGVFVGFLATLWLVDEFGIPWIQTGRARSSDRLNTALIAASVISGAIAVITPAVIPPQREQAPGDQADEAGSPAKPVVFGEIPRQPQGYQTRTELHDQVRAAIAGDGPVVCVLIGARGVGKTQLAGAYARACVERHWPVVAWIAADQPGSVVAGLAGLADELALRAQGDDAETAAGAARAWLERSSEPVLVVFDSAVDPDSLVDWLPRTGRCQVLVTSSRRPFVLVGTPVQVGLFTLPEAVEFLVERTGRDDREGAGQVAEELGRLALALAQAASVIRAQGLAFADYATRLRTVPVADVLGPVPGDRYPQGLAEAVLLSLGEAEQGGTGPVTRRVVEVLAMLSPAGVSRDLLYAAMNAFAQKAASVEVDRALGRLTDASLASISLDGGSVAMHRLVQHVVRDRARTDGSFAAMATAVLDALDAGRFPQAEAWGNREKGLHLVEQINVLWRVLHEAAPGESQGTETPAAPVRELVRRALELRDWAMRNMIGMADLDLAISYGNELVADRTRLLGPDHPDTLASRNGLAEALLESGRLLDAMELLEKVDRDRTRVLGPDHPDTLATRHDLARAYRKAGRLVWAIELNEAVVTERVRVLGADHADTLLSRNTLAYAYRVAGRTTEAVELFELVAADRQRVLGPFHPQTLRSRHDLAYTYRLIGRLNESIALYEAVVDARSRTVGPDHPDTLRSRNNLAGAFRAAGQLDKAMDLVESVVRDRLRVLGPHHPHTLMSRNVLARVYRKFGRLAEAISLYEVLVTDRLSVLGPDHPDTLTSRDALAFVHALAGHTDEAIGRLDEVVADRERVLGPDHPDTLTSRDAQAFAYRLAGRLPEAVGMFEAVVADRLRVLGHDHPDALTSRQHLAVAYRAAGSPEQAVGLLVDLVADTNRVLGPDHPHTLSAQQHVARAYLEVGRTAEAIEMLEEVVADRLRVLCRDHPDTLRSQQYLATAYLAAGRAAEATALFVSVESDCRRVLGPDHPYTQAAADDLRRVRDRSF